MHCTEKNLVEVTSVKNHNQKKVKQNVMMKTSSMQQFGSTLGIREKLFFIRSEEHTSELQSRPHLVCRLLLEKKKKKKIKITKENKKKIKKISNNTKLTIYLKNEFVKKEQQH